jgi:hypothetical protein
MMTKSYRKKSALTRKGRTRSSRKATGRGVSSQNKTTTMTQKKPKGIKMPAHRIEFIVKTEQDLHRKVLKKEPIFSDEEMTEMLANLRFERSVVGQNESAFWQDQCFRSAINNAIPSTRPW